MATMNKTLENLLNYVRMIKMKNNTVIMAPHSYVVVHRKQSNIYDVYEIETGEWVLSRTNPDNILRIFSEACCTFKFIDENAGEIYTRKEISDEVLAI